MNPQATQTRPNKAPQSSPDHFEFATRALIAAGILALVGVTVFLLWWAKYVWFLLFAGIVFEVFLQGLSDWVSRITKMSYKWSLSVVVVLLLVGLGLTGWLLGGQIVTQFSQLAETLPKSFRQLQGQLEQYEWGQWLVEKAADGTGMPVGQNLLSRVTGLVSSVLTGITAIIVIGFVGLYGAIEPRLYRAGMLHLLPKSRRTRGDEVLDKLDEALRNWLIARVISMVIIGVLVTVGLWLIGVPLALALGIFAMFVSAIPNLGPVIAAVPAVLVAGTAGGMNLVWQTIALKIGIQTLESYILLPLLQEETVYLPPILSILTVVFFGYIGGILGAFIAAPLLVVIMILIKMLYVEDVLNDHSVEGI